MITSSREGDFATKQEGNTDDGKKNSKAPTSSSTSTTTPWSRLKDPRIVRVSRAFGGKDRHSKVCTVRGLRDRRVRLSVATAIQLYDLQDRLGLNQPSKVVDWLLDAAKHEIDELPPLQMPPGNFGLDDHQLMQLANHAVGSTASQSNRSEGVKMINSSSMDRDGPAGSNFWNSNAKSKDVATKTDDEREEDWSDHQRNGEEKRGSHDLRGTEDADNVSSTNFFLSRPNQQASIPGLLNNAVPYNPIYRCDPSNFSLSQMGGGLGYAAAQTEEDFHNFNVVPLPLPSGSQVLVCPPPPPAGGTTQPYFPSHVATSVDLDPKQMSHFQMLMGSSSQNPSSSNSTITPTVPTTLYSIGQPMRPLHFSMVSKPFPPSHQDGSGAENQSHN